MSENTTLIFRQRVMPVLLVFALLVMGACENVTASSAGAAATTTTSSQTYGFQGHPTQPTILNFETPGQGITYTAEVRDKTGRLIASLHNDSLQTASLTIAPGGASYELIVSAPVANVRDAVRVALTYPEPAIKGPAAAATRIPSGECHIVVADVNGAMLRQHPDSAAQVVLILSYNTRHMARARTANGWYRVTANGQTGWVLGSVVTLDGWCSALPVQSLSTPTSLPAVGGAIAKNQTANYDAAVHYFNPVENAGQPFTDAVSYPGGDGIDQIRVATAGLSGRAYVLTLTCTGSGIDNLRWGRLESPDLACTDSLSFTAGEDFDLLISLPGGLSQQYVNYALNAVPVALNDDALLAFGVDRDSGGGFSNAISTPAGDSMDSLQVVAINLDPIAPNNYRSFHVTLACSGTGTEYVRWGPPGNTALACGTTALINLSHGANLQNVDVVFLADSPQSYVDYTLTVVPVAPVDNETYPLTLDRDSGGRFNEALSYPGGDHSDRIDITVSNLLVNPPHNYREFTLTLLCSGRGVEHVRWGSPDAPDQVCGGSIQVPFLYDRNLLSIVVTLPDAIPQSYISYTLITGPVQP